MEEPSVLDYVKALLTPWKGPPPRIPPMPRPPAPLAAETPPPDDSPGSATEIASALEAARQEVAATLSPPVVGPALQPAGTTPIPLQPAAPPAEASRTAAGRFPWRSLLAFSLALVAQMLLEPQPDRQWFPSVALYLLAFTALVWAQWRGEWTLVPLPAEESRLPRFPVRWIYIEAGVVLAAIAFWLFGGNRFDFLNLFFWLLALLLIGRGFWVTHAAPRLEAGGIEQIDEIGQGAEAAGGMQRVGWVERLVGFLGQPRWQITVTRWSLVVLGVAALVIYFRVTRLDQVPPEMVSDQAEKLWDVWDLLHGQTKIFFERNTGREGLQMYLTAAVIRLFGTGYSFLSLKIGTTVLGLITLVYIYLIGVEAGSRRAGLFAAALAGIAYWPNVITRVALRFTLFPAFAAPALYYLIRGIRRGNRNDFVLAGIALGLGLHGYTPFRIVPIVVAVAVLLYLLHRKSRGARFHAVQGLGIIAFISSIIFLPLLRFWMENPEIFNYRALTRMGTVEQPLPGPAWQIFLSNLGKALVMFFWDNGEVWTISIPHRPALEPVSAVLFFLGASLLLVRYLKQRHWQDLFWLVSIPLLMMPSILSLAFPAENPILNRTAGAIIPVFLLAGIALDSLMGAMETRLGPAWGPRLAWITAIVLVGWSAQFNYDLTFVEYQRAYELSAWNTSEMGKVMREFAETIGSPDTAWVMGYPYWVDTRLVGINAGQPYRDTVMRVDRLPETLPDPRAKLFLVNPLDEEALAALRAYYPQGSLKEYDSRVETKNFLMYFVPPVEVPAGQ